jgi:ribokinase
MYDVITVGSATMDAFAKTKAELVSIRSDGHVETLLAYQTGSKILITDLDFFTGGGGTNTAVSFARLGLKTAFIGKLGKDHNGQLIIDELAAEHVDFIGSREQGQTGYSVVLDSIEDDRTILTFKGVNNDLTYDEIDKKNLNAKWFYFSSMMDESYRTLEKLAEYAKEKGMKVAFNPSSYLCKLGAKHLESLMRNIHLLVLNKEEAEILVGRMEDKDLLRSLSRTGPLMVVITDGKRGAKAYDGSAFYSIPGNDVKVRETTGAGDAFASGFLAGYILSQKLEFSMSMGMANATSVVKYLGAKNRLLTYKEAIIAMRNNHNVTKSR